MCLGLKGCSNYEAVLSGERSSLAGDSVSIGMLTYMLKSLELEFSNTLFLFGSRLLGPAELGVGGFSCNFSVVVYYPKLANFPSPFMGLLRV